MENEEPMINIDRNDKQNINKQKSANKIVEKSSFCDESNQHFCMILYRFFSDSKSDLMIKLVLVLVTVPNRLLKFSYIKFCHCLETFIFGINLILMSLSIFIIVLALSCNFKKSGTVNFCSLQFLYMPGLAFV